MKSKATYWIFLTLGFVGIILQMYKLYNDTLAMTLGQGVITVIFTVFIFRPRIMLEVADLIINKLTKNATKGNDK